MSEDQKPKELIIDVQNEAKPVFRRLSRRRFLGWSASGALSALASSFWPFGAKANPTIIPFFGGSGKRAGGAGSVVISGADPYYGHTPLLMHFDGANAGTTFTDSSPQALAMASNGNAKLSTAQSRFGTASFIPATSSTASSVYAPLGNSSLYFAGDFTIEFWMYVTSYSGGGGVILDTGGNIPSAAGISLYPYDTNWWLAVYIGNASVFNENGVVGKAPLNVWHHYALQRQNGQITLYRDGVKGGTGSNSTNLNVNATFTIGGESSNTSGQGAAPIQGVYIDDLRVTNGFARYGDPATTFTPPAAAFPTSYPADPFWNGQSAGSVSFLGQFNGTLSDLSLNSASLTNHGSVANVTPAVACPTGQSTVASFNGTSQYLSAPGISAYAMNTGDFCIEAWIYKTAITDSMIVSQYPATTSGLGYWALWVPGTNLQFTWDAGSLLVTSDGSVTLNRWHHVAAVRTNGVLALYVDGTLKTSGACSAAIGTSAQPLYVGAEALGSYIDYFWGAIAAVRITKGVARYPGTVVQTALLPTTTAADNLHPVVALQTPFNSDLTDKGPNTLAATANGSANVANMPYYSGGSTLSSSNMVNFDGATEAINFPASASIAMAGNFTVEGYFWLSGTLSSTAILFGHAQSINPWLANQWYVSVRSDNKIQLTYCDGSANPTSIFGGTAITTGTLHHFAVTRADSANINLWLDGAIVATAAFSITFGRNDILNIGRCTAYSGGGPNLYFPGYIGGLRITSGVARYTSGFTPANTIWPTGGGDANWANVTFLAQLVLSYFNESSSNASTGTIIGALTLPSGNIPAPPNGATYALSLNGTSQTVTYPSNSGFAFGTGDFTIEGWIYPNDTGATAGRPIFLFAKNGGVGFCMYYYLNQLYYYNGGAGINNSGGTAPTSVWSHFAVTRLGSTLKVYVNGALGYTGTDSQNYSAALLTIGNKDASWADTVTYFNGFVSDLRITKGAARYPSFSLPTAAFGNKWVDPYWSYVKLLLNFQNNYTDSSTAAQTATANGSLTFDGTVKQYGSYSLRCTVDGSNSYVSLPVGGVNFPGANDWTIEGWFYVPAGVAAPQGIFAWGNIGSGAGYSIAAATFSSSGAITVYTGNSALNGWLTSTASGALSTGWHHVAACRIGGSVYAYVDGNLIATGSISGAYTGTITRNEIGGEGTGWNNSAINSRWYGWRWTNGVGRYLTAFTPPLAAFPTSSS